MHQPFVEFADVHRGQLLNVLVVDAERKSFAVQLGSMALRTGSRAGKLLRPLLCRRRRVTLLQQLDVLHHTFVGCEVVRRRTHQLALDLQPFVRTVEYLVDSFIGQVLDRRLQIGIILLQQSFDLPEDHAVLIFS